MEATEVTAATATQVYLDKVRDFLSKAPNDFLVKAGPPVSEMFPSFNHLEALWNEAGCGFSLGVFKIVEVSGGCYCSCPSFSNSFNHLSKFPLISGVHQFPQVSDNSR